MGALQLLAAKQMPNSVQAPYQRERSVPQTMIRDRTRTMKRGSGAHMHGLHTPPE
jgi:hypothetical protein